MTSRQSGTQLLIKRALDVAIAGAALVATSPLMLGCAALVRATMGSPVLFRQPRPGRGEQVFTALKFRTMRDPAPGATTDAERLTPVGRVLRATSLDELPQLLNVVRGEMSLVGPRPLLVRYLERYAPEQRRRHAVLPGITGWAQINGRNATSWEKRFEHDLWYVDNWSVGLDLRILGRTLVKVIRREGIANASSETMPEFMGGDMIERKRRTSKKEASA